MRVYWNDAGVWGESRKPGQTELGTRCETGTASIGLGDHIVEQHIHNLDVANWVKNRVPGQARGVGGRQVRTEKKFRRDLRPSPSKVLCEDGSGFSQVPPHPGCW